MTKSQRSNIERNEVIQLALMKFLNKIKGINNNLKSQL